MQNFEYFNINNKTLITPFYLTDILHAIYTAIGSHQRYIIVPQFWCSFQLE